MLTSVAELSVLAFQHGTPLYLLDAGKVLNSMKTLRDGLSLYYPKLRGNLLC
jgi:hypothetical protein